MGRADAPPPRPRHHALVVADGDVPGRAALDAAWPGWADDIELVIAADGGLARVAPLGLTASLLVGDLDSIDAATLASAAGSGLPIHRAPVDKDESDAELALLAAIARGAGRVTMLGAFGGPRLDHALANLWLLAHPALAATDVLLLDAGQRVSLLVAPDSTGQPVTRALPGRIGGLVSLLPFGGEVLGVTTVGLRYPLADEPLLVGPARGLSNVRLVADASVTIRAGRLLVVETAVPGGGLSSAS